MLSFLRKKMKVIMIIVAFVFAASMFYGLGYTGMNLYSEKKDRAFLKVNGKTVDPARFNSIFNQIRGGTSQTLKPQEALFLQNLALSQTIDFSIALDEARKKTRVSGVELNANIEQIAKQEKFNTVSELRAAIERSGMGWGAFRKMVRDDILVQKMANDIRNSQTVTPDDLKEVRASHILIRIKPGPDGNKKALKLASEIKEKVKEGGDFASLAKKYSEDPGSKDKGGDLGFFTTQAMLRPFSETAFSLKVLEIGGPVKTDYGYHIIKVTDARLRKIKGEKDIESAVRREKQERAFQEWFYKLKQKAKIEILDHNLKALDFRFKGKMTEAIDEYKKAVSENPGNPYSHLFLGFLFEDAGNLKLAISEYADAVRLDPANFDMYLTLGKAYLKNGQRDLAMTQFKKASLIAGDKMQARKDLVKIFTELNLDGLAAAEKAEIRRIEKKEAFEKGLQDKSNKIKTD